MTITEVQAPTRRAATRARQAPPPASGSPAPQDDAVHDDAQEAPELDHMPRVLRWTRTAAALITLAIGVSSFVLSFASLYDLAHRSGVPADLAWLWPLTVDGTILQATMAIIALSGYAEQLRNRRFFWAVLTAAALVSVSGNALHALIPPEAPFDPWLAAGVQMVAPLSLLATTHGLAVIYRFHPQPPAAAAAALTAQRVNKWEAVAAVLVERGRTELPVAKVADILRQTHDLGMSHRKIGLHHNVHHATVGALKNGSLEVLNQSEPPAPVTSASPG